MCKVKTPQSLLPCSNSKQQVLSKHRVFKILYCLNISKMFYNRSNNYWSSSDSLANLMQAKSIFSML